MIRDLLQLLSMTVLNPDLHWLRMLNGVFGAASSWFRLRPIL